MTQEEREVFLFNQTAIIVAGRLTQVNSAAEDYIKGNFRKVYEALAEQYKLPYIKNAAKNT